MAQLVAAVVATVVVVVFAMSNTHHVHLSMGLGAPFQIRLISLLGAAFLAGMVTSWISQLARRAARQAHLRRRKAAIVKRPAEEEAEA